MLDGDDDILVILKDKQRLHAMQQPVTKALLRLFNSLHPENISMAMTAGTQDMVWAQLQRYIHETLPNAHIRINTV